MRKKRNPSDWNLPPLPEWALYKDVQRGINNLLRSAEGIKGNLNVTYQQLTGRPKGYKVLPRYMRGGRK